MFLENNNLNEMINLNNLNRGIIIQGLNEIKKLRTAKNKRYIGKLRNEDFVDIDIPIYCVSGKKSENVVISFYWIMAGLLPFRKLSSSHICPLK